MSKAADDAIPAVSVDEALPTGPVRRSRRRAERERRSGEKKEGDVRSRREARIKVKPGKVAKGYRVIVSGLLPNTSEAQVRALFHEVKGKIVRCTLGRKVGTNQPVGVAEVVYETKGQADRAAQILNKATVDGRVISVQSRGLAFFTDAGKASKKGGRGKGKGSSARKEKKKPVTADSLNANLDAYMA